MTVDQTVIPPTQGAEISATEESVKYNALLAAVTNTDGTQKYSSIEAALSSLTHTQEHIQKLELENKNYKDNATSSQELYDMLNQGKGQNTEEGSTTPQNVSADDVVSIINQLKENELKVSNKDTVFSKLAEIYGSQEEAVKEYDKKAQELNVSTEFLDSISTSSPAAALAYFSKKGEDMGAQPTGLEGSTRLEETPPKPGATPKKSLLIGATTEDLVDYWKTCAPTT